MNTNQVWQELKTEQRQELAIAVEARSIGGRRELQVNMTDLGNYGRLLKRDIHPMAALEMAESGLTRLIKLGVAQSENDLGLTAEELRNLLNGGN